MLIRYAAAGLCHSDEHLRHGDIVPRFPLVGGHEGAGVIEEVGAGVTRLQARRPRDLLVPAGLRALPVVLDRQVQPVRPGRRPPGRLHAPTARTGSTTTRAATTAACACSARSPSESVISRELGASRWTTDLPLDKVVLIGCGVPTGWGSAVHAAATEPGDTIVIYGIGGIGINAVQGAALAGAPQRHRGRPAGRTSARRPSSSAPRTACETAEEAAELAYQLTSGVGADKAIVTVGVVDPEVVAERVERRSARAARSSSPASPTPPSPPSSCPARSSRCSRSGCRAACSAPATRSTTSRGWSSSTGPAT